MAQKNDDEGTEWIFCTELSGGCSGLNPVTRVIEKIPKVIKVHGQEVKGWLVKVQQEKSEGHLKLDIFRHSDE
jgi:hypothetical protein